MPSSPSKMTQRCPQAKHRTRPFSRCSYKLPSTVYVSRISFRVELICFSQNLLSESRQYQLRTKMCGLVTLIEDWVDLGDLERNHFFRVGEHLHGQMCFAIVRSAADRSSHAGRFIRIEEIRVQRRGESVSPAHDDRYCFVENSADSAFIDFFHCEDTYAGSLHQFAFQRIHFANSQHDDVFRPQFWSEVEDMSQLFGAVAEKGGHRHSVNVAARRNLGRVHIGVRVEPDEAELFVV